MTITDGTPYMQQVRMLLTEYTQALGRDLSFQKLEDELRDPAQKYAPPNGKLLVALEDGTVLGMVAYHRHSPTRCEMKRLYVRPACRGRKIGQSLIAELLRRARRAGYWEMVLDTLLTFLTRVAFFTLRTWAAAITLHTLGPDLALNPLLADGPLLTGRAPLALFAPFAPRADRPLRAGIALRPHRPRAALLTLEPPRAHGPLLATHTLFPPRPLRPHTLNGHICPAGLRRIAAASSARAVVVVIHPHIPLFHIADHCFVLCNSSTNRATAPQTKKHPFRGVFLLSPRACAYRAADSCRPARQWPAPRTAPCRHRRYRWTSQSCRCPPRRPSCRDTV